MFVDLRAAFDSVDRGILIRMRKKGIREGLIKRVEEVLRETKSRVRVGRELGKGFWTGSKARVPIELLVVQYSTDIEEEMEKVKWGE